MAQIAQDELSFLEYPCLGFKGSVWCLWECKEAVGLVVLRTRMKPGLIELLLAPMEIALSLEDV